MVTLPSLRAYEYWASAYPPFAHNALMQAEEAAMLTLMPELSGRVVLDLACGTGRYSRIGLERGAGVVIGVDNSRHMLQQYGFPLRAVASSESIPLATGSVDVVVCGLALGHLAALRPSLVEMARVLRVGGTALVSDFHPFIFLNGQRRTFTSADGKTYAVEHYAHLYADYQRAARAAGLTIEAVLEPRLGVDETVRFENAGTASGTPVIIAYRFCKS